MRAYSLVFTLLLELQSAEVSMSQTLIFPHIADGYNEDGSRWSTEIDLINTSSVTQSVTVSFFAPNGKSKCFVFSRIWGFEGCPFTLDIPPNDMKPIVIDSGFRSLVPLSTGWGLVNGTGGIKGLLVFRRISGAFDGRIVSEAAFTPGSPSDKIEFFPRVSLLAEGGFSEANVPFIGYAMVNPDPSVEAVGVIQLINVTEGSVAEQSFTLPPGGQIAKFLEQSFGPLNGADVYFARIVTRQGRVAAIGLRMVGALIASIPPSQP